VVDIVVLAAVIVAGIVEVIAVVVVRMVADIVVVVVAAVAVVMVVVALPCIHVDFAPGCGVGSCRCFVVRTVLVGLVQTLCSSQDHVIYR